MENIPGASAGGGGQGVEVGARDGGEEQGGVPCAWPPKLPSWTRNQVNANIKIMLYKFMAKGVPKKKLERNFGKFSQTGTVLYTGCFFSLGLP